jgi:hypothetical protein
MGPVDEKVAIYLKIFLLILRYVIERANTNTPIKSPHILKK